MSKQADIELVEAKIRVRLIPEIYAFSTNTIPRYLKVGDTFRGVDTRIEEWRRIISAKLQSDSVTLRKEYSHAAMLDDGLYFRDYSIHEYLKGIGKRVIEDPEIRKLYSNEFFAQTAVADVEAAIKSIEDDFKSTSIAKRYKYYSVKDNRSATIHGANDKEWKLRPNQKTVVDNFLAKRNEDKLLMYAVMRFGKSFTAMSCALAINARRVLIVSAKADVIGEWQKTVETPKCFKDYKYLDDTDLKRGTLISDVLAESADRKVALCLTLQNLAGVTREGEDIKDRLKQVFKTEFDLIIVDETHYGAWANAYGKPLKDADEDVIAEERKEFKDLDKQLKKLKGNQKLHLSGTPYNLLFDNRFTEKNIIATCQFKDILQEKQEWEKDHFEQIENGEINPDTGKPYQEYDNPYFGFPQMLRFAFNLPAETRKRLEKSKSKWTLNDLFETVVENDVASFVHEQDVLKLSKAVDGAEETDSILSFLDIPKIKDNDVCKHMVFVLPRKYACDAMERLLHDHAGEFHNLQNYEVLNITGHTLKPELDSVEKVKAKIEECEKAGQQTITLTVYKMLTGVTVKEWDTMIMLKNTKSAQEYDQATFRIQNQYVQEYTSPDGDEMKIDKKPQTILVDFDPMRMFTLQGMSTRIVEDVNGGAISLEEAIKQDLQYFPIIAYNADRLVQVDPADIVEIITEYNRDKSIMDSVQSVEFDPSLLNNAFLLDYIRHQSPTSAKNTLETPAHGGTTPSDVDEPSEDMSSSANGDTHTGENNQPAADDKQDKDIEKKYRMCIAKLSFYAFLSKSNIESLQDIIDSLNPDCEHYADNRRIFDNIPLSFDFINELNDYIERQSAFNVNDAISRANLLSKDEKLSPQQRALNAIKNFNRFSESEIVTPNHICAEMVNAIGKDVLIAALNGGRNILDIASKTGEFAYAIYSLLKGDVADDVLQNGIYSIPTSGTAYEFTRHIYEVLGLNISNIVSKFNAYDLLDVTKTVGRQKVMDYDHIKAVLTQNKAFDAITFDDVISEGETDMITFDVVVGNPPYQEMDGGGNGASSKPIYQFFIESAKTLAPKYLSMIFPARWYTGGKGLDDFRDQMLHDKRIREIHDFPEAIDCFSDVQIKGGICYILWDKDTHKKCKIYTHRGSKISQPVARPLLEKGCDIFIRYNEAITVLHKVSSRRSKSMESIVSTRLPFGIPNTYKGNKNKTSDDDVIIYVSGNDTETKGTAAYIPCSKIRRGKEMIGSHKVFIAKAGSGSDSFPHPILPKPFYGAPDTICNESYLVIGPFSTKQECENVISYVSTRFFRFLVLLKKNSQNAAKGVYQFVPIQDFTEQSDIDWSQPIHEIDNQLYAKYGLSPDEIHFIEDMIKPME